jgi:hypothetical protein
VAWSSSLRLRGTQAESRCHLFSAQSFAFEEHELLFELPILIP